MPRKLIHDEWEDCSLVDIQPKRRAVDREFVSERIMRSADEVIAYLDTPAPAAYSIWAHPIVSYRKVRCVPMST